MTLSSQKLYYVGSIFLLILFLLCELSRQTILHCTCLDSAYHTREKPSLANSQCLRSHSGTLKLCSVERPRNYLYVPTIIKPYHIPVPTCFITQQQSCFYCVTRCTSLPWKEEVCCFREFTSEFKAKRLGKGKRKKTTHNVIVKSQVSGIYN